MNVNVNLTEFERIKLAKETTIGDYRKFEANKDKIAIANFIYQRFSERYIAPIENTPSEKKHGFSIMAVNCLMIEALESFRSGYADTKGESKKSLVEFKGNEERFYKDVRCGILHQAETRGGWKIRRSGVLFDETTLTINATEFLARLKAYLEDYKSELEKSDWNSETWRNLRRKMSAIIENCKRSKS
jgi:hypothetical protein